MPRLVCKCRIVEKEPPRRRPAVKPPVVEKEEEWMAIKKVIDGELTVIAWEPIDPKTGLTIPSRRVKEKPKGA